MFKKLLVSFVSAALLVTGPITAAAQTMSRGVIGGVNTTPMIVNSLHSGVQAAPLLNMPVLSPNAMTMSAAIAPTVLPAQLTPAVKAIAVAPVAGSPLAAIQFTEVADQAPKLNALFDQSSRDSVTTEDSLKENIYWLLSHSAKELRQRIEDSLEQNSVSKLQEIIGLLKAADYTRKIVFKGGDSVEFNYHHNIQAAVQQLEQQQGEATKLSIRRAMSYIDQFQHVGVLSGTSDAEEATIAKIEEYRRSEIRVEIVQAKLTKAVAEDAFLKSLTTSQQAKLVAELMNGWNASKTAETVIANFLMSLSVYGQIKDEFVKQHFIGQIFTADAQSEIKGSELPADTEAAVFLKKGAAFVHLNIYRMSLLNQDIYVVTWSWRAGRTIGLFSLDGKTIATLDGFNWTVTSNAQLNGAADFMTNAVQKISAISFPAAPAQKSGGDGLSDKNDPTSPNIKLFVYQLLVQAGLSRPVTDVRELIKPGSEVDLLTRGFKRKESKREKTYFVVLSGNTGQRVAYFPDGSVRLTSVVEPKVVHTLSMQNITLDAKGSISNTTEHFDDIKPGVTGSAKNVVKTLALQAGPTQWVSRAKAEFKKKYVGGFDSEGVIGLPAESKLDKIEDLAQLPTSVKQKLENLSRQPQSGVYKLSLGKAEVYAVYMHDALVSEEVWLFDNAGRLFANGTAEEVGGFRWEPLAVQRVATKLGPKADTIAKIDEYRFSEIPAPIVQGHLAKAIAADSYLSAQLSTDQQVHLVMALMNGLNARRTTRELISKFMAKMSLPEPKISLAHGGQNIMSELALNSLFTHWKPNFAAKVKSGKVALQSGILPTAAKSDELGPKDSTIGKINESRFSNSPEAEVKIAKAIADDSFLSSQLSRGLRAELIKELLDYSNHRLSAGEIITLFIARSAAATPSLNNDVDHHSPLIKLYLYQNLVKAGLNPITDVLELMKPSAEAALLKAGFKRQADVEGTKRYLLRADINNSQRVSFYKNGSASLLSVSKPDSQLLTQTISIDIEGYIFNDTESFGNASPSANFADKSLISKTPAPKEIDLSLMTPMKALALLHKQFPKVDFMALIQEAREAMPDETKPIGKLRFLNLMQKAQGWTLRLGGQFRQNESTGYFDATFEWDGSGFFMSDSNSSY